MALESFQSEGSRLKRKKRNPGSRKIAKTKKNGPKDFPNHAQKQKKIDPKLKKFLKKKARDYNSEDDEDVYVDGKQNERFEGTEEDGGMEAEEPLGSDDAMDEENEIEPGIAMFGEGHRAFNIAFKSIMKSSGAADSDPLGPVLSAHKKLVAEKLAEEDAEKKAKGETRREKHAAGEKGHVKPSNYLDTREKFLIGVATKGVVKLFNAVSKARHAQKGLNPSRSKDAKVIRKRRKEAFFSEIGKKSSDDNPKGNPSSGEPTWEPLRDDYMLTNSKLKNWDKMHDAAEEDDAGFLSEGSSSE